FRRVLFLSPLRSPAREPPDLALAHAVALDRDDVKLEPLPRHVVADLGRAVEEEEDEAADGVDLVVLEGEIELLADLVEARVAERPQLAADPLERQARGAAVGDLSDDLLVEVFARQDAGGAAELVHDDRDLRLLAPHLREDAVEARGLRDEGHGADELVGQR